MCGCSLYMFICVRCIFVSKPCSGVGIMIGVCNVLADLYSGVEIMIVEVESLIA